MMLDGIPLLMLVAAQSGLAGPVCTAMTDADFARPVTGQERRSVVEALARMTEGLYVEPAKGRRLAEALKKKLTAGGFGQSTGPAEFADALTAELQIVVPDKHLKVRHHRVEPSPTEAGADTPKAAAARRERFRRSAAYDGHGIREVKILPGNVGYLALGEFWTPEVSRVAVEAAMTVLRDSDALIIDLRGSYGGHEDVIPLIMGYLLPAPMALFTSVDRLEGKTRVGSSEARPQAQRLGSTIPIYVLTSRRRTFSAAEAMALALKRLRGATIVGEQTRGGANGGDFRPLNCRFDAFVPYFGSTVDGVTWEGVGIAPDVAIAETQAFDKAYRLALARLIEVPLPSGTDSLSRDIQEERRELLGNAKAATPR